MGRFGKTQQIIGLLARVVVIVGAVVGLARLVSPIDPSPLICESGVSQGLPQTCVPRGSSLVFTVAFEAGNENGIILQKTGGKAERRFNNYYRKGAGNEWHQGPGKWTSPPNNERGFYCYFIIHKYKAGGPSHRRPWINGKKHVITEAGNKVVFEDAKDRDHNDAVVSVDIVYHVFWPERVWNVFRYGHHSCDVSSNPRAKR